MRYIGLLLATLFAIGCGTGAGSDPQKIAGALTPPSIMAFTPSDVPVNSVPFTMMVKGTNFGTDAVAFWHGTPQFTTFVSSTQIMVNITQDDLTFSGAVPIYVRTGGMNSNTVNFNVTF
jgi:hypothetical protein